jgi:hypothetical protein
MMRKHLQVVPEHKAKGKRLFSSDQAYEEFRASLQKQVKGELDRQQEARRQSEEQAKRLLVS